MESTLLKNKFDKPMKSMLTKRKKHKGVNKMKMKIDFEKAKKLLEDKPNISEEEYNKRFWELWEQTEEESER